MKTKYWIVYLAILLALLSLSYRIGFKVAKNEALNILNEYNCYEKNLDEFIDYNLTWNDTFFANPDLINESKFKISSPSDFIISFTPDYKNITINSKICEPFNCLPNFCFKCDLETNEN